MFKTLGQFNQERDLAWRQTMRDRPGNGIACPACGNELFDSHPEMTLTSWPPQKNVACVCGFIGYRLA